MEGWMDAWMSGRLDGLMDAWMREGIEHAKDKHKAWSERKHSTKNIKILHVLGGNGESTQLTKQIPQDQYYYRPNKEEKRDEIGLKIKLMT